MVGLLPAVSLPLALFWFGFTSKTSIHWIVPVLGESFLGMSTLGVFVAVLIICPRCIRRWRLRSRQVRVAAMPPQLSCCRRGMANIEVHAGNCFLRSMIAGIMPLFITPMYRGMGPGSASAVWASIACFFMPVPFVLYRWGVQIRRRSKHARQDV